MTVGVFRDERPEQVIEVVSRCGLRGAQLHGGETAADVRAVRQRVQFLIRALPAGDARLSEALTGSTPLTSSSSTRPSPVRAPSSTGRWPKAPPTACASCWPGGSTPTTWSRPSARCGPGVSTRPAAWRRPRDARTRPSCAVSWRRPSGWVRSWNRTGNPPGPPPTTGRTKR